MEKLDLVPIGSALISASDLEAFDCGNPMIDQYLVQQANVFDEENRAKTFLLLSHQGIVGYYTLIAGCLEVEDIQNQVLLKKPYVNLAYFAINAPYQKQGYGRLLMGEVFQSAAVIGSYAGAELIYIESTDESVPFYELLGYQLLHPLRRPENFTVDTSTIEFPMSITLKTLHRNGYYGYLQNFVRRSFGEELKL